MKILKYLSAYLRIYEKALNDVLKRKWLLLLWAGVISLKQIFNLASSVWLFGVSFLDALMGDKEKIFEAAKNSRVGEFFYKSPLGMVTLVIAIIGVALIFTLVESFFETVLFKTFIKKKIGSNLKSWVIESGKKYYRLFLYLNLSGVFIGCLSEEMNALLILYLSGANILEIKDGFWMKYFLPCVSFLIWIPLHVLLNIAKVQIVRDKRLLIALAKAWGKMKVGSWYVLKGYAIFSFVYSGLWFGLNQIFSSHDKSSDVLYWLGYGLYVLNAVFMGVYFRALYCRLDQEKIPVFAGK